MIIIYSPLQINYLKLIKSKATKLFPEPERYKSIKVYNTTEKLKLDSVG